MFLVMCVFWLAPNAFALADMCSNYNRLLDWTWGVRWTGQVSIFLIYLFAAHATNPWRPRREQRAQPPPLGQRLTVLDAPLRVHAPKLLLWAASVAAVWCSGENTGTVSCLLPPGSLISAYPFAAMLYPGARPDSGADPTAAHLDPTLVTDRCGTAVITCASTTASLVASACLFVCILLYLVSFIFYIARGFRALHALPYSERRPARAAATGGGTAPTSGPLPSPRAAEYRTDNIAIRLQARSRLINFAFIIVSESLLWWIK